MNAITHRDQIHGDVRYDPIAVALLNTSTLQRLGRVYQLGYAHLVYRGGTHTRLSHVMGASHVAGQLVDFLRQNYLEAEEFPHGAIDPEEFLPGNAKSSLDVRWDTLRYLVRWAALLHDIGHIPLGHTLEDEFDKIYVKHDRFDSPRIPHLWNEVSPGKDSEIRRVFRRYELLPSCFKVLGISGEQTWQTVMLVCLHKEETGQDGGRISFKQVLQRQDDSAVPFVRILREALARTEGTVFFPYMADIVGNTICADYLDYLRRDPTNVGLDVLRDDRVASRFFIGRDSNKLLRMALSLTDRRGKPRLDTCTGVVELVRQRFRFAEIIYYHKTKVAASAMLAKVFALVGKPPEVGATSGVIQIDEIPTLAQRVVSEGPKGFVALRQNYSPRALLDPEIGDETLLLWMQERAWKSLEDARLAKDLGKVTSSLRGLSLLQGLVRRELYKVCFTIDQNMFKELDPGSKVETEVERRIDRVLKRLRQDLGTRSEIETKMAVAAGWPDDSLLLYVPPRKSQAKGIETGALDAGDVVTLGTHPAVKDQVLALNESYKGLWRIIVLVHPKYRTDVIGLSKVVDTFLRELWQPIETRSLTLRIREAAWFHYIPENQRPAAAQYQSLISPERPDWSGFEASARDTTDGTVSTGEHADRAVLLSRVVAKGGSTETIRKHFGNPNSLSQRLLEIESQLTVEGREGITPQEIKLAALDRIASDLLPNAKNQPKMVFPESSGEDASKKS